MKMATNYVNVEAVEPESRSRSETVLEKVKKEGVCSTYVLYLVAVGVLFCSAMLGIVIWGDVIAKAQDPRSGVDANTENVLVSAEGVPLATTEATIYSGTPGTFNDDRWHLVKVAGGNYPTGVVAKHQVTGVEMVPSESAVYLYTNQPDKFFKFAEKEDGSADWEYYTERSTNTKCSISGKTCHVVTRTAERRRLEQEEHRRRLQSGSFNGGANYANGNLGLNGSLNQDFGNGWSGSLNGNYNHNFDSGVGGWNAGAGLNYESGNTSFGLTGGMDSGGGYNVGVGFSFSW